MSLITFTEQQAIKPISKHKEALFLQLAKDVQNLELTKLLGAQFLQSIEDDPASTANDELLNGATFEDNCGDELKHRGLKFMLAHFNYSAYVIESNFADTYTGFVSKDRQDSIDISTGDKRTLQQRVREIAFLEWEIIEKFLCAKSDDYPQWNKKEERKVYVPKFTGIRKTRG